MSVTSGNASIGRFLNEKIPATIKTKRPKLTKSFWFSEK
jgi:hypothetical protein